MCYTLLPVPLVRFCMRGERLVIDFPFFEIGNKKAGMLKKQIYQTLQTMKVLIGVYNEENSFLINNNFLFVNLSGKYEKVQKIP